MANGKTAAQVCQEAEIADVFPLAKEYGRLKIDHVERPKEFEQENSNLRCMVANLSLDNLVLKDIASGNF